MKYIYFFYKNKFIYTLLLLNFIFIIIINKNNKKKIFVIDRYVPNFNKDAGGRCTFMYLKLFNELGLKVTFLGADFENPEPYTTILQQNGIKVLYGNKLKKNIKKWFSRCLKYYNFAYLQRPSIALKYLEIIRNFFSGKIIFFGHDLHYIRLLREYKLKHDEKYKKLSEIFKKKEMDIFSRVDIIHVVGNYEQNILKEKFHNKSIRNIPIYIYENQLNNVEKDFSKRNGIIFVGGFSHSPNVDAVLWFINDIFPKITKKYPDIIFHIVGSNIPRKIMRFQSENIKIEGFLSDEDLKLMYGKCRIAVAPLRYGAGVKGKIVEAAYNQIPIITTSVGAEGLDSSIGAFLVEDNPEKMADLICKLYFDFSNLKKLSDSGKIFIEKYFSVKKAKEELMKDINDKNVK